MEEQKLVFKRMSDADDIETSVGYPFKYALFTEEGKLLPCQVKCELVSAPGAAQELMVTFHVDFEKIVIEGSS